MSYSASVNGPRSEAVELVAHALSTQAEHVSEDAADAFAEVASAIVEAVDTLVYVTGLDADQVGVTVSGHVEPGHVKREGWSADHISVSVRVIY